MTASKKILKAAVLASILMVATPSGVAVAAGIPVVDLTNFAQNLITAIKTTEELKAKYEEMRLNYMTLQNAQSNMQKVPVLISKLSAMETELNNLHGSLEQAEKVINQRYLDFATSGAKTWEEYYALERTRSENNVGTARANYMRDRQVLNNVNEQYARVQSLQGQIAASTGPLQQQQLLNSHMNLIATQNAQLLEIMAAREAKANVDAIDAEAEKERGRQISEAIMKAATEATNRRLEDIKKIGTINPFDLTKSKKEDETNK